MKNSLKFLLSSILFFFISHNNILGKDKPIIFMVLDSGIVKIQTFPEKAPNTVKRIAIGKNIFLAVFPIVFSNSVI